MKRACLLFAVLCGCESPVGPLRPDAGPPPDSGVRMIDAAVDQTLAPGLVEGSACGVVSVTGSIEIAAGTELVVCAGSTLLVAPDSQILVRGTLRFEGTSASPIQVLGDEGYWSGMVIEGSLEADFVSVFNATLAISGAAGSSIRFDDSHITAFGLASLYLANGGTLDRTSILGGNVIITTGGMLSMTDSVVDRDDPGNSPDCMHWAGGGATLDHVHITNCHCPLHFQSTTMPVTLTASILDGAAVPIMIADTTAQIHGNAIEGATSFEDIGGGVDADVSGNYYGGGAPVISTDDATQFVGSADFLTSAPTGIGPRI